ncbi:MAG: CBS domain-containing protein [Lewinellaceae bacterium]|nr:CBS domain-containing protein [Lewinellaceae bacterium]
MGEQRVTGFNDEARTQQFVYNLLRDVQALEYMLQNDWFESDITRIGAEQEMCLVDTRTLKPATIAMEVLDHLKQYPWAGTELAKFNLEINMDPHEFTGSCLRILEEETIGKLGIISEVLKDFKSQIVLTGILPTIRKYDLEMHNLTPKERYFHLMDALRSQLQGNAFELRLHGIDELLVKSNTPLLEAANTSFQVHLQVAPANFVQLYNISQALVAPIMALAANSPIVFGRRLWHESRIALFQQALDVRTTNEHMRERSPRVSFGTDWISESILDIYREDIARFRSLICPETEEDAMAEIAAGRAPYLRALQVHNSTVYRWNRPCYGISPNGKPHLRIENRVLPAGPTVADEVANAAFWLGAMVGCADQCPDVRQKMSWEDARDNFEKSARFGIDSKFTWFHDQKISAVDLILKDLVPLAEHGLKLRNVDTADIDRYMGIIKERAMAHQTGARWQLRAFTKLKKETSADEALTVLTSAILKNQHEGKPGHTWQLPELADLAEYRPSRLRVEEFMQTDLFTVRKDDLVDLVSKLMDWRKVRYMPVEDTKGHLSGLITSRLLLRYYSQQLPNIENNGRMAVQDIMIKNPITVDPNATIIEALQKMRENKLGCLPVVKDGELIGIITEMDFLRISARLIERLENT